MAWCTNPRSRSRLKTDLNHWIKQLKHVETIDILDLTVKRTGKQTVDVQDGLVENLEDVVSLGQDSLPQHSTFSLQLLFFVVVLEWSFRGMFFCVLLLGFRGAKEIKVKIESVDLWGDRMNLVPHDGVADFWCQLLGPAFDLSSSSSFDLFLSEVDEEPRKKEKKKNQQNIKKTMIFGGWNFFYIPFSAFLLDAKGMWGHPGWPKMQSRSPRLTFCDLRIKT